MCKKENKTLFFSIKRKLVALSAETLLTSLVMLKEGENRQLGAKFLTSAKTKRVVGNLRDWRWISVWKLNRIYTNKYR